MNWIVFTFIVIFLVSVKADCVIMSAHGAPQPTKGDDVIPRDYSVEWSKNVACPEYNNTPSCCNGIFNEDNYANFQKIATAFGNHGGGCDVCAANIERFYCVYSCSPHQSDFMKYLGEKTIVVINDTDGKLINLTVAEINITINADHACQIFQSCSKITFLTEISAGASALGFLTFQFDRGITDSFSQVHISLSNKDGLNFTTTPHKCNETFPGGKDQFGYPIPGNCSCNFCADSCEPLEMAPYGHIMDGFEFNKVALAYLFAILLTIGFQLVRKMKRKQGLSRNSDLQNNLVDCTSKEE